MLTRRQLVSNLALLAALAPARELGSLLVPGRRFRIGACDWSIGKNSDIGAFDIAKEIGLDGIMVNMGTEKNNLHLRDTARQDAYLEASRKTGVKISSLAIGEFNNIPFKSDPRTEEWLWDTIDVAKKLGAPVILLAFFNKNDLRNDPAGKKEVIRRLKRAAPKAEKSGIILGLETYLDARQHLEIMQAVGSKNVKVYLDFRNTTDAGHDLLPEVKKIGRENICEFHMKENGFLLGKGTVPWQQVRDLVYELGSYGDGWMQIEGAMPTNAPIVESYKQNLQFLRNLFSREI